jgi:predicted Na+-dependent transporter
MHINERLVWSVLGAAVLGLLLPSVAASLNRFVLLMLAGQVLGVALTISASQFAPIARKPSAVAAALLLQWTAFPLIGLVLLYLAPTTVGRGALVIAIAPAEITSALVAILAGGTGALAIACMFGSVALSTILTPMWLVLALGTGARIDETTLITELLLSIAVPLFAGITTRTIYPALGRHTPWFLDLSALSVLLVVFIGAGSARQHLHPNQITGALAVCLILLLAGLILGTLLGVILRFPPSDRLALIFPIGMREFGVATAIALAVVPASVGIAGLYGILLMAGSTALASYFKRRD